MSFTKHNVDTAVFSELIDVTGRTVLDVGSGGAGFVAWLNEQGATAFGVECSDYMLEQSRQTFVEPSQIGGVGQQLPVADNAVSVVTFMNSLHHMPRDHMESALQEAARVVAPGGYVYVVEPVAEGPGYETSKLIDDEAEVRSLAQAAMRWADGRSLRSMEEGRYLNRYIYGDVDDYFDVMIGVDQSRAAMVDEYRQDITEAFERFGIPSDRGTSFDHPMHYRLFAVDG